ncbi:hypothetical protein Y032_0258g442 [Ancylostoma ceylanicum]|uniref:Uncharacterized protein n=1 Tax=Ancylostoma ceylanicum TaxID=53326 RepID=A0A016SAM8_9BILA|nr:hypothetical protein Y032_0258g442 [Ancylostoma ceylanicum]
MNQPYQLLQQKNSEKQQSLQIQVEVTPLGRNSLENDGRAIAERTPEFVNENRAKTVRWEETDGPKWKITLDGIGGRSALAF